MFSKEQSSSQGSGGKKAMDVPLKKSDRRKLLERARQYFACEESKILDTVLGSIFTQGSPVMSRSLSLPNYSAATKMLLYSKGPNANENRAGGGVMSLTSPDDWQWPYKSSTQFVWMALEEKGKVLAEGPTIAMWAAVCGLAPLDDFVIQVPSAVSKYLCRGADLMRAGMRSLPSTAKRKVLPICVQGNPQPFAVGYVRLKESDPWGIGTQGVGADIWNVYGDDLWRQSSPVSEPGVNKKSEEWINPVGGLPFDNGHFGNVGFQNGKIVLPIHDQSEEASSSADEDEQEVMGSSEAADAVEEAVDSEANNNSAVEVPGVESLNLSSSADPEGSATPSNDEGALGDSSPHTASLHPEEVLHQAVLRGLWVLGKKDLPMPVGSFYTQYILPNRLPGTTVDLKATSFKKLGPYLQHQIERGLVHVGPDSKNPKNKDPLALLIAFDKKHDDFRSVMLQKPSKADKENDSSSSNSKLVFVNLFTIPNPWVAALRLEDDDVKAVNATSEERKGTGMLTASEARNILEGYIQREELIPKGMPALVALDGPLTQLLYKGQNDPPQELPRKELVKVFTSKLGTAFALVQMPGSKIVQLQKGQPPKIEIDVNRRQSNKFVTRIRGLEDYGIDPAYFSKDVGKRLASSATIDTTAAAGRPALKKGRVEITMQGNLAKELEALLTGDDSLSSHGGVKDSEYDVPKQVLSITLRKGVPGRGKQNK